mmetsp:Transcript_32405/g.49570  ORF Transcript_32405/g.49570 Transcript_32405/m.49570 type:complete len:116 (+) Transcript_32405:27-374(+)
MLHYVSRHLIRKLLYLKSTSNHRLCIAWLVGWLVTVILPFLLLSSSLCKEQLRCQCKHTNSHTNIQELLDIHGCKFRQDIVAVVTTAAAASLFLDKVLHGFHVVGALVLTGGLIP